MSTIDVDVERFREQRRAPCSLDDVKASVERTLESAARAVLLARKLEFLDLAAVARDGIPQLDYVVPALRLARGDVALWGGPAGAGKTTCAVAAAVAAAARVPFLDQETALRDGESVLYVDTEAGADDIARTFIRLGGAEIPGLYVCSDADLSMADPESGTRLERAIVETRAGLVFLDTFNGLARGLNENDAGDVSLVYGAIQRLRNRRGTTFVMLHHVNKAGRDGAAVHPLERIRGSSVHSTAPSLVIYAEPVLGGGALDLTAYKRRGGRKGPLARVEYIELGDMIALRNIGTPGESETVLDAVSRAVVDLLADRQRHHRADIVAALAARHSDRDVDRALRHLAGVGRLTKPDRGVYQLAGEFPTSTGLFCGSDAE